MSFTNDLLYLLLLYAVLDEQHTLTTTSGMLIGAGILLFESFFGGKSERAKRYDGSRELYSDCGQCEHRYDCDYYKSRYGGGKYNGRRERFCDCGNYCNNYGYCGPILFNDDRYYGPKRSRYGAANCCGDPHTSFSAANCIRY